MCVPLSVRLKVTVGMKRFLRVVVRNVFPALMSVGGSLTSK